MSELVAILFLAFQPAATGVETLMYQAGMSTAGVLSQRVQYSPKCVTPSSICYIEPPQPVGNQCLCPDQNWGVIQP